MDEINIDQDLITKKLQGLDRLLSGLNAYGSLELGDYNLIIDYLRGAFNYAPVDE
ncbi:MAG: hypothetical protein AB7S65_02330 [Sulfuricurvum sp.]